MYSRKIYYRIIDEKALLDCYDGAKASTKPRTGTRTKSFERLNEEFKEVFGFGIKNLKKNFDQGKVIDKFKNAMRNGIIEGYENKISEWEILKINLDVEFYIDNITNKTLDEEMEKARWYIGQVLMNLSDN